MKNLFYCVIFKPLVYIYTKFFLRIKIIGIKNIPKEGRVVLAGNHHSNLDSFILIAINKRIVHILVKNSIMNYPQGIIFKNLGMIPVNRNIHDQEALNKATDILNNDGVIGIFPEGKRNITNEPLLPFKIGAVKMASVTNSKIVPFVITGNYNIFKNNLCIEFLESINIPKKDDLTEYNQELMDIIRKKIIEKRK